MVAWPWALINLDTPDGEDYGLITINLQAINIPQ